MKRGWRHLRHWWNGSWLDFHGRGVNSMFQISTNWVKSFSTSRHPSLCYAQGAYTFRMQLLQPNNKSAKMFFFFYQTASLFSFSPPPQQPPPSLPPREGLNQQHAASLSLSLSLYAFNEEVVWCKGVSLTSRCLSFWKLVSAHHRCLTRDEKQQ